MLVAHPAVSVAVALLEAKLPQLETGPVWVSSHFPDTDHDRVVRVDRLHGGMTNMVTDAPFMLFECWARAVPGVTTGDIEAERLANHVRACLTGARSERHAEAFVRYWKDAGANSHPDLDRPGMARWQVIGTLGLAVKR